MMLTRRLRSVDPALAAIVAEGFLSRLSFGLISFALPLYAYQKFGLSLTEIGVLLSLNLAVAVVLKPVAGSLADRVGMRPTFTVAIVLRSLVSLLLAFVTAPWQLFAIRGTHGISIALRDPSGSVLLVDRSGKKVASAFAWYQTAKSLAGAIGKAAAGVLLAVSSSSFTLVFLCAFVLSALPLLVVLRYVREVEETAEAPAREPVEADGLLEPGEPEDAPPRPRALAYAGLGFLIASTAYMLTNLFPVFAVEYAGLTTAQTGLIYLIVPAVILTGPVFGWLSDHVSRKLVLSVRSAANVGSSLVYLVAPSFAGVAVGRMVDELGKAAFRPAWGAVMAEVAGYDRRTRARTMGSMSAGEDAGEIAGPILAGFIWSVWGVPVLLGARIVLAAVTEVTTLLVTGRLERAEPSRRHAAPHRLRISSWVNWARSQRRPEPQSRPMEVEVRRTVKMTEAPPRKGSLVVGDRVGELLAAAEEEAQRIGRDVHEEVAAIRSRSDRAVAVGVAELEGDVERIKSEAVAEAQVARAEAERYAVEQLHAANERAAQIIAKAEVRAKARRAAADEAARLVDEAYRRQAALREAAEALEAHLRDGVDERLQAAQRSLQNLAGSIGEFMGEPQGEDNDEPAVAETIRAPRPPQAMRTAR